jgi:DNA-binding CsgD family transcriptional regulator
MLSTRSLMPLAPKRSDIDFPRKLADTDFVSFLIEKAQSLGLEVSLRDSQPKAVEIDAESEHCGRCLEVASRLSSPRDTASDQEIVDWFRGRRKAARTALSILSLRERQVVILVAHGYSNKRAAAVLHVSEKTVEKYRGSACRKLHAQTSAELALLISAADVLVAPSAAEESRESSSSRR